MVRVIDAGTAATALTEVAKWAEELPLPVQGFHTGLLLDTLSKGVDLLGTIQARIEELSQP